MTPQEFKIKANGLKVKLDKFLAKQNVNEIIVVCALSYLLRDIFGVMHHNGHYPEEEVMALVSGTKDEIDIFKH